MHAAAWQYWEDRGDGFIGAFVLLVTGDPETWSVIRQSLLISLSATVPSVLVGVPMGMWLALTPLRGRRTLLTAGRGGYGWPPVVVGLIMSILLLRHGPLGFL